MHVTAAAQQVRSQAVSFKSVYTARVVHGLSYPVWLESSWCGVTITVKTVAQASKQIMDPGPVPGWCELHQSLWCTLTNSVQATLGKLESAQLLSMVDGPLVSYHRDTRPEQQWHGKAVV